ncbi:MULTISPECIES: polysaccharide pyruvyl transferase family protein [Acidobacteriaceae]|uniref:polysaccharide pyruvyl transferase family protein n=1 Tax=Acidobacteriaceae TaxID=204434 RepID=UPI00131C24A4|nr:MULTISPECIES: polysaccharide pyruvyl transferase family protein [Acidobacteriaceae]MDW5265958.1 polysaccharide pyruvyl transferase family protein [Edaphobacter sp.]
MKVLLLGVGFNTQNMGVGALASGAVRCLRAHGRNPDISLLDYGTEDEVRTVDSDGRWLSIPIVTMRFSWKLYLGNNIIILLLLSLMLRLFPFQRLREAVLARNRSLRRICEADIAASISGGDSFSDIYGLGRFFYVCLPQILVLLLNKDLVLLPQTVGPFMGRLPRWIARMILGRAQRVYSRDYIGLEQVERLLGHNYNIGRHRFCYDLGFVVEPRPPKQLLIAGLNELSARELPIVGFNISGLLWTGGYSHKNMFGLRSNYQQMVHAIIDHLISSKQTCVLLLPHVFGREVHSESDALVCEQIFNELGKKYEGRLGVLQTELDQCEIKSVIGSCEFFIGSRMHACIAALSQQIPAVAVAYSEKFSGVLNTIGVPSLVADARQMDNEQILRLIDEAYDGRKELASHLAKRIPEIKATVLALGDELLGFQSHATNRDDLSCRVCETS